MDTPKRWAHVRCLTGGKTIFVRWFDNWIEAQCAAGSDPFGHGITPPFDMIVAFTTWPEDGPGFGEEIGSWKAEEPTPMPRA